AVGELVRDGCEGTTVPPDAAALATALAELLHDEPRRSRLAAGARVRAGEDDWSAIAPAFLRLAESARGRFRGASRRRATVRRARTAVERGGQRSREEQGMSETVLGERAKRNEDPRLLTGRALFLDDVELPGMLHVAFLRSSHAHARLGPIDTRAARDA